MKRLDNKGLTMIEMLTATAVASILIIIVMSFTVNAFVQISIDTARSDLLREAQLSLDAITRDIRLSANADAQNRWEDEHAPNAPLDLYSWQSDSTTLILATAVLDANKDIVFEDPLNYISEKNNNIYFINNKTLYKRTLASPVANNSAVTSCPQASATATCPADRALVNNVISFNIRYINGNGDDVAADSARSIELIIKLEKVKYGNKLAAEYKTRTVFRNE